MVRVLTTGANISLGATVTANVINFCNVIFMSVSYISIYIAIAHLCVSSRCICVVHLMMLIKQVYVAN